MAAPDLQKVKPQEKDHVYRDQHLGGYLDQTFFESSANVLGDVDATTLKLMNPSECDQLLQHLEQLNFSFWSKNEADREYRNANTVEVVDTAFAERIWQRVKKHVTPAFHVTPDDSYYERGMEGEWQAVGVNEHLLFARYNNGGHFSPHTDGNTIIDFNYRSMYTLLIYLNTCGSGGGTLLWSTGEDRGFNQDNQGRYRWQEACVARAPCQQGLGLFFFQDLPHEGEPVGPGAEKIVIRTDIMYRRVPPVCDDDKGRQAYQMFRQAELEEGAGNVQEASKLFRKALRLSPEMADILGM
eukprot:TRINITY_DN2991_c0_g1_i1.p1 TRINITY_DN2991_c0_g1~~TRINITY_DN2991_c0_g1_i1.p1  ORF type:complete len:298 (+),score=71.35 TRINITY_DN2991_c0_g1_i1:67-960(+)